MTRRSKKKNKNKKQQKNNKSAEKLYNIKQKMIANTTDVIKLAVYGEYRRQDQKDHKLLKDSKYLGTCETLPKYTLYDLKDFAGLTNEGSTSIIVDVYEIKRDYLTKLDKEHNYNMYREEPVSNTFIRKSCWTPFGAARIYFYNKTERNILKPKEVIFGDWLEYQKLFWK